MNTTLTADAPFDILKRHKTPAEIALAAAQCSTSFARYREWMPSRMNRDLSRDAAYCNAALGLCGELDEFTESMLQRQPITEVASEFADVVFYGAWLANLLEFAPKFLEDNPGEWIWMGSITHLGMLRSGLAVCEPVKKTLFHGVDRRDAAGDAFAGAIKAAATMLARYAHDRDGCNLASQRLHIRNAIAGNVTKLETRYPGGFVAGGGIRTGAGK